MFAKCTQGPFIAEVVLFSIFIADKFIILLVYGVVCQVHKLILLVNFLRVRLRGESRQTLLVHVDSQRLITRDADINAEVKLVSIDQ